MQTLRKKTSPCKYRNDPGRFFGDGVIFKAKLIGILEVGEARGDRMCQEALQDLKMAIRAAGEHKQRITINVTIDGLRLRDERTGDSLYHHPVHKISFIAQDMTDSRAFGYIFGSPDSGHRFFGIKTDKAASQVVLAMRDLFQVVFELKKKEIELARQHIQSKTMHDHQPITLNIKSNALESSHVTYSKGHDETNLISKYSTHKEMSPESVADLVDLEQELSSIQRGITQMERITPNEPPMKNSTEDDPFGDSFTQFSPYNLLPPPESSKSRHAKQLKPPEESTVPTTIEVPNPSVDNQSKTKAIASNNGNWLNANNATNFDETKRTNDTNIDELRNGSEEAPKKLSTEEELGAIDDLLQSSTVSTSTTARTQQYVNAFSDLDPLGTGKFRPYIDKKYFFQDLKNPPKKVLKDLSGRDGTFSTQFPSNSKCTSEFASFQEVTPTSTSFESHSTLQPAIVSHKNNDQNDECVVQFSCDTQIFSPNNNGTHGTPPNLSRTTNGNNRTMLITETDPFSPRVQNFDPFEDDFSKKSLNAFDFSFNKSTKSNLLPDTRIANENKQKIYTEKKISEDSNNIFNGPLQKFTKRDSNMKRLQESDSFSESETAPEPPPRPDVNSYSEPPPLPPKKQFSDIVIRPRVISPLSINRETMRYDYLSATKQNHGSIYDKQNTDDPPTIPLPLRRIGRPEPTAISSTTIQYPGPGRPEKKREDDYLTPISIKNDVPLLHPPPKAKGSRNRRPDSTTPNLPDGNKVHTLSSAKNDALDQSSTITPSIPDITLSQLLTLGIDDLASKLNVPSSKLSTMTIVELTKYLSDFIEKSSQKSVSITPENSAAPIPSTVSQHEQQQQPQQQESIAQAPPLKTVTESSAVFKVSFDDSNDATFIAKFDDNFGIDSFIPNFDQFDQSHNSAVDRYAVFREIIDQELKSDPNSVNETKTGDDSNEISSDAESPINEIESLPIPAATKIDTKITEAISQAKDRYAALRDIILVEDLFEKSGANELSQLEAIDQITENIDNSFIEDNEKEYENGEHSSPDANISINLEDHDDTDPLKTITTPTISQPILSNKDDLEIDEYMNRAISNLSLDSRDHLSPLSKSPASKSQYASTSPLQLQYKKSSPIKGMIDEVPNQEVATQKATLNSVDMSTSPIPIQSFPKPILSESMSKSPIQLLIDNKLSTQTSITPTSPLQKSESGSKPDLSTISENRTQAQEESWAVFDADKIKPKADSSGKSPREETSKIVGESPYSSDDKADWKVDNKKWPKGHTSSSSRDLSPWDDDAPDYRRRGVSSHPDRHGFYMRHARRMNSCDDEYEYDGEMARRRERRPMTKTPKNFSSRENFDSDSQNWYHPNNHRTWSPPEDDENCDQGRTFERCYERSTFGPPYEKRGDLKSLPYSSDRHLYKGRDYDKRGKYNRDYGRPYGDDYDEYDRRRKEYADGIYDSYGMRSGKMSKDYFYERDKRSFDRESTESFDSNGRRRKSFGSGGDVYNNLDYRERYSSADRKRSLRKSNKIQRSNEDEYEQDSEEDANVHRSQTETRSLQRRPRKSSGSSPWDGEDIMSAATQRERAWKRPASASESERKLAENRRLNQAFSGSDGEKDRRFYRKPRSHDREADLRSNYSSMRYSSPTRGDDYEFEGPDYDEEEEEQYNTRKKDRNTGTFSERRKFEHNRNIETMHRISRSNRDVYYQSEKDRYAKLDSFDQTPKSSSRSSSRRERDFNYESYEDTPHPNVGTSKFDFEQNDQGFESDFNAAPEKNLRFSTDFSIEKPPQLPRLPQAQPSIQSTAGSSDLTSTPPQQKIRFDDKITVSKFDLFEDDDFSKAEFSFENEDQWVEELPKKINLKNVTSIKTRHDNIKKSESVNIFARNNDDPFEDDDFFQKSEQNNNFAKFEGNL